MTYTLGALVDDLRSSYRERAPSEAIGLMIEAIRRGMAEERDVLTSAAIMLCSPSTGERPFR